MKKYVKKEYILYGIMSYLFACVLILVSEIQYHKGFPITFMKEFHFDFSFFFRSLLLGIPCFFILLGIFVVLRKIKFKQEENSWNPKIICSISFIGIFLSSLLFLITFYPGSNMNDTLNIIYSPIYVSNQHPLFYNLAISLTYHVFFKLFHSMNQAFFATGVIQIILMDTIITYSIYWFHKTFKNKLGTVLLMIYFICTPIISNYNSVLIKDSIFAVTLLLHLPILYQLIISKGTWLEEKYSFVKMTLVFTATVLIRNNGIYLMIFMMIILLFIYKKYWRKLGIILIILLVAYKVPSLVSLKTKNEPLFQEKAGIPIQQIAYVIYNDGKITKEDQQYINKIMKLDILKELYNPYNVDNIKWADAFHREYLNETKSTFIKTWFHLLPHNFEGYVKGYLLTTYGLWSTNKHIPTQSYFFGLDLSDKYAAKNYPDLHVQNLLPSNIQKTLEQFYKKTTLFFGNGICFWMLIILTLYVIHEKKASLMILTLPLFGVWITLMLSAPISYIFRYMCPFAYLLPFIFLIFTTKIQSTK